MLGRVSYHRHDGAIVLRLWSEREDRRVRARIVTLDDDEGDVAIGIESILDAVERALHTFELGWDDGAAGTDA